MKLPAAPAAYSRADQQSVRMLLETEDRRNLKIEGDVVLGNGLRLVAVSANGTRWSLGVSDAGATTWTAIS